MQTRSGRARRFGSSEQCNLASLNDVKSGSVHDMFAGLAGGWLGAPHCTRRQRMQTRLALRVVLCCSQVQCDLASSQKDVKRGSVHVMFAGLAGGSARGPALHSSPTHANALGFARRFVLQPSAV